MKGDFQEVSQKQGELLVNHKTSGLIQDNRIFAWLALVTGAILLVPLVAMQLTSEVNWSAGDFLAMGLLLFTAGSLSILVSRKFSGKNRLVAGIVILAAFLYIWAELAVGIFTNLGN